MNRQQKVPAWVRELMKEFTKPPAFLEQQFHAKKSTSNHGEDQVAAESQGDHETTDQPSPIVATSNRRTSDHVKTPVKTSGKSPNGTRSERNKSATNTQVTAASGSLKTRTSVQTAVAYSDTSDVHEPERAWRATLAHADIPVSLPSLYGWDVRGAERADHAVRVIDTSGGSYAVKQTHISPKRVQFLYDATQFAKENGFARFAPFTLTQKQRPYVFQSNKTYYATEWLAGNPANFASLHQVGQVAAALAGFHESTRGFVSEGYTPEGEFRLARLCQGRANDLRTLLAQAERKQDPDAFDRLFLELAPALRQDVKACLELINLESCKEFLEKDEAYPGICHLDVIPSNFIFDKNKKMNIIDLDLATFAPRVLDVAHLLRRSMQQLNWSSEAAYACFLQYNMVRTMQQAEYLLVEALMTFPYHAWRVAHTRYRVFQDEAQLSVLKSYAQQEERRQAFLKAFSKQVTRHDS